MRLRERAEPAPEDMKTAKAPAYPRLLTPAAIAAGYALVGGLWITYSDSLLAGLVDDPPKIMAWALGKGLLFIAVTGVALYFLLRQFQKAYTEAAQGYVSAERHHAAILDALPEIVFALDAGGAVETWNSEALTMTGYPPEYVAGRNVVDFAADHDKARAAAALRAVLEGRRLTIRLDAVHRDGSVVPYRFLAVPLRDDSGAVIGAVCTGRDISEEIRGEGALLRGLAGHGHILEQTVDAIAALVEQRDRYLSGHQDRVTQLALAIADRLGLSPEVRHGLRLASKCHDIGKIHIPAEILSKPGRITPAEYEMIKTHPRIGYEILRNIDFPWPVAEIVRQHHERYDGSGYPQGLSGDAIRVEARIIGVADTVEAMTSHRPYRPGLGINVALREIREGRNSRYDPAIADACLAVFQDGFNFGTVETKRTVTVRDEGTARVTTHTRH